MKKNIFKAVILLVVVIGMASCDLIQITTPKFDGTYKCTTTSDNSTKPISLKKFDIKVDMQALTVVIDGISYTGAKVANDGKFTAEARFDILLVRDDLYFEGTITESGSVSGTITDTMTLVGGIKETRKGKFTGSKS